MTDVSHTLTVRGCITKGYRVASGPNGTIAQQIPIFKALGLDLSSFHPGTINVSVEPLAIVLEHPERTFAQVKWCGQYPAENFSFSSCFAVHNGRTFRGWIYSPHPSTKIGEFQAPHIVEILAEFVDDLSYGDFVELLVDPGQVRIVGKAATI